MKSKIYYIILSILLSLTSCNSWLDVTPQGQMEATDMLSSEKGYNSGTRGSVLYIVKFIHVW